VTTILERIDGPSDLRGLSAPELAQLAGEIRLELVDTVTATGGHLASSLGAVELAIALHRVFDSPTDKIIWDVGHQSYAHKLLTGRRATFSSLRQYSGLSGFPDTAESEHDAFGTGHASTSISASLGMAVARDLAGESFHVVAVIGDGSLTGGMAFEGLNNAGHLGTRIIVILNDNAMAISPSVGGIARTLNMLTLDPRYHRAKEGAERVIKRMPWGSTAWDRMNRLKSGIKEILIPTQLWEALGFKYIGPVDGHNMAELEEAMTKARGYSHGPILIHAVTTKGKGYEPAEDDCVKFHGLSAHSPGKNNIPSYSEVFGHTMVQLFRENEKLVGISAAMMDGTCLHKVAEEFPNRVFDVGICEQHAVTFAAGLATQGLIPVVAIYSTFMQRALDQVIHDVCVQDLPVIFAIDRAGIVGEDGKTHQGTFDLSYLGCVPNLTLAAPADENELRHLLHTAVRARRPMAIRYPRGSGLGLPPDDHLRELPVGKGEMLKDGSEVAIIAIGSAVHPSLKAAELLREKSVDCAVFNARYAKPLDFDAIRGLAKSIGRLVTVEENTLVGGFGSEVLGLISNIAGTSVLRIGIPDEYVQHGSPGVLRTNYGLDPEGIARRILSHFPELVHPTRHTEIKR
jgi:1-deoxy-D-xylulose-5-phosphate synthase